MGFNLFDPSSWFGGSGSGNSPSQVLQSGGAQQYQYQNNAPQSLQQYAQQFQGYQPVAGLNTPYAQKAQVDQGGLLAALQRQQSPYNTANQQLMGQLQRQASGNGPNPAQAQFQQNTQQNIANQLAASSNRGGGTNAGMQSRQAADQGAALQQQAAGQASVSQAQQQLNAQGALAGVIGQGQQNALGVSGQNIGLAGQNAQLAQQIALANQQAAMGTQQFNAGAQNQANQYNAQAQQNLAQLAQQGNEFQNQVGANQQTSWNNLVGQLSGQNSNQQSGFLNNILGGIGGLASGALGVIGLAEGGVAGSNEIQSAINDSANHMTGFLSALRSKAGGFDEIGAPTIQYPEAQINFLGGKGGAGIGKGLAGALGRAGKGGDQPYSGASTGAMPSAQALNPGQLSNPSPSVSDVQDLSLNQMPALAGAGYSPSAGLGLALSGAATGMVAGAMPPIVPGREEMPPIVPQQMSMHTMPPIVPNRASVPPIVPNRAAMPPIVPMAANGMVAGSLDDRSQGNGEADFPEGGSVNDLRAMAMGGLGGGWGGFGGLGAPGGLANAFETGSSGMVPAEEDIASRAFGINPGQAGSMMTQPGEASFASGDVTHGPQPALIGEAGKEAVVPIHDDGTIDMHRAKDPELMNVLAIHGGLPVRPVDRGLLDAIRRQRAA